MSGAVAARPRRLGRDSPPAAADHAPVHQQTRGRTSGETPLSWLAQTGGSFRLHARRLRRPECCRRARQHGAMCELVANMGLSGARCQLRVAPWPRPAPQDACREARCRPWPSLPPPERRHLARRSVALACRTPALRGGSPRARTRCGPRAAFQACRRRQERSNAMSIHGA